MNILQLRTKLSTLNIKWNNLPHLSNFTKYSYVTDISIDIDEYRIVGYFEPNQPIYHHQKDHNIYVISDLDSNIYLSLGFSNPTLWYKITLNNKTLSSVDTELISDLIDTYDVADNVEYDTTKFIMIGDMYQINQNLKSIQNYLLTSNVIECLMWGSKYDSYPFNRHEVMTANSKDKINYVTQALEQKDNYFTLTCRTLWSKSYIKIKQTLNYITTEIRYNKINNKNTIHLINKYHSKNLPYDMPTDVAIILISLPSTQITELINETDNIHQLITLLKILIPKSERYQIMFDLDNYCQDKDKIKLLRAELG